LSRSLVAPHIPDLALTGCADAMLELGDLDGQRTWKAVLRAVQEITRIERGPSERVN